jgi:hypothetical protein
MNTKQVIGSFLFLIACAGLGIAGYRMIDKPTPQPDAATPTNSQGAQQETSAPAQSGPSDAIVYYFHTNKRCVTCNRIEELTRKTVEEDFADELAQKRIELRIHNIDEAQHDHFRDDFLVDYAIVVIASQKKEANGRYESLDKVWTLNEDEAAFREYLQKHIRGFLTAAEPSTEKAAAPDKTQQDKQGE